ncbi:hypothetical protein J4450_00270 [Candidatus Micrarchaeota archaeon]|nr:hypothetical protein [Candidatus Micrarchaeota archaeon]
MDLVVDTNILLACFKPNSVTRRLIAIEDLHLFTTEYQLIEVKEYVGKIADKYSLSESFIEETFMFLEEHLEIVPKEDYQNFISKVENLISDKDDLPALALAAAKNIAVWSNDPHFEEQDKIKVYKTKELIELIKRSEL